MNTSTGKMRMNSTTGSPGGASFQGHDVTSTDVIAPLGACLVGAPPWQTSSGLFTKEWSSPSIHRGQGESTNIK